MALFRTRNYKKKCFKKMIKACNRNNDEKIVQTYGKRFVV